MSLPRRTARPTPQLPRVRRCRATRGVVLATAALATTLAACSGGGSGPADPAASGSAASAEESAATMGPDASAGADAGVVDPTAPSPLEAAWARIEGRAGLTLEDEVAEGRALAIAAQDAMAACMAAEGFEYVPWLPEGPISGGPGIATLPEYAGLDPVERARQIGYGFIMDRRADLEDPVDIGVDPNLEIREALSDEGRRMYGEAAAGCSRGESTPEEVARFQDPVYVELQEDTARVEVAIWQDPRVVALDRAWAGCVADAGFPGLAQPYETINLVSERWEEWRRAHGSAPAAGAAELQELVDWEVSLAVADATCQADLDYVAAHRTVRDEHESAFVADREDDIAYLTELFATE
ncbi:hypothetical protein EDD28_0205 [Salana multivorans]|uniref:Uncharacterized protein n=1 Tax=Salana multivorans TaxID=120377 RepID=A0A3N2D867_9MICO|nr:hypothetical protein [Salana multivorans]ROR95644.1 hypothetical protein EDD28_0205 [Salana multivorans]